MTSSFITCIFQMLIIAKAVAVGLSSSIAIISSLVDSAVDLLSGIIIWWTSRAMKKKNIYSYPEGTTDSKFKFEHMTLKLTVV